MAKRREEEEESSFSWYDQPLYDTGEEDDLFKDDDDDKPSRSEERRTKRVGPKHVGVVGGCFNVILIAVLSLLIFLVIGVGVVLGGRALGVFPQAASSPRPAESAPVESVAVEAENACDAQGWWTAQQGHYDYFVTTYARVTIAPPAEPLDVLVPQMQARRDEANTMTAAPCLAGANDAFSQGMNGTISAVESLNAGDRTSAENAMQSASRALANVQVALWDLGVATDPNTPSALNIPRGGNCDAAQLNEWYAPFRQQWEQINPLIAQLDMMTISPQMLQESLATLEALRGNLTAVPAPECANRITQLTIISLNSYINGANAMAQGNFDAARESASTYARSHVGMNAWLAWLGLEMV